jgi:hypothetical protein
MSVEWIYNSLDSVYILREEPVKSIPTIHNPINALVCGVGARFRGKEPLKNWLGRCAKQNGKHGGPVWRHLAFLWYRSELLIGADQVAS